MGKSKQTKSIPFTPDNVKDKELVIKMLQYETEYATSDNGQALYKNSLNNPLVSLTVEKTLNRITLSHFGFENDDTSVETFRTIFRTYYKSPDDYDEEVINASYYMKGNKCMFYKEKDIKIGDVIPNCNLCEMDGETQTTLYDIIQKEENANYVLICGFSMS